MSSVGLNRAINFFFSFLSKDSHSKVKKQEVHIFTGYSFIVKATSTVIHENDYR